MDRVVANCVRARNKKCQKIPEEWLCVPLAQQKSENEGRPWSQTLSRHTRYRMGRKKAPEKAETLVKNRKRRHLGVCGNGVLKPKMIRESSHWGVRIVLWLFGMGLGL